MFAYKNPCPNNIKHEAKEPNKKYVSPAAVEDSESLFIVHRIYSP